MQTKRCFIAIDLPEHVKEILAQLQQSLRVWPARVKWVEQRNFHLTLKFLGEVPSETVQSVENVISEICSRHIRREIFLNGIGAFPNAANPRVLWVGIRDVQKNLTEIWSELENNLAKHGFDREERQFSPHLTLGRVKEPAAGLAALIRGLQPVNIVIPVDEIKLMESRLSGKGPEYSCITSFYLQEH